MSTILDCDLVRARRLELGLSERKLAAVTGLGQAVVRNLEAGTNHKDLTLGDLQRLADALALDLHQMLVPAPVSDVAATAGPVTREEHFSRHVAQLGALLYDVDRLIPVDSLALTTGLTLDQTHDVLDELDRRLRPIGLLVHRLGNAVKLRGACEAVTRNTLRRTWRAQLARRGLDAGQARLLHQARVGQRHKTLSNDQQVTTAELVNGGLLVRTAAGGAELSDDVRYSLLLDEDLPLAR